MVRGVCMVWRLRGGKDAHGFGGGAVWMERSVKYKAWRGHGGERTWWGVHMVVWKGYDAETTLHGA
eukprot:351904-Chlamydomonas_euryale.AAC.5